MIETRCPWCDDKAAIDDTGEAGEPAALACDACGIRIPLMDEPVALVLAPAA